MQPFWTKDPHFGKKNAYKARCETVHEKPNLCGTYKHRRCVLPATALVERADDPWLKVLPQHDEALRLLAPL